MTSLSSIVVRWVEDRIQQMLKAPPMWGSNEAVELQILLLTELRALACRPDQETQNPRRVLDLYVKYLGQRFPDREPAPLCRLIDENDEGEFAEVLRSFYDSMARNTLLPNPFEHSQVAIRLTFGDGLSPTASAVTGYYEEFRRATRAASREAQSTARRDRAVERVTDFVLEDSVVTQPNGAPGQVLLRLGTGFNQDRGAEDRVRGALSSVVTLAEWANTDAPVGELGVDDVNQRTHTAVQALRLLPRHGVKTVTLGGTLVARSKPVDIHEGHEKRFLEVVSAESTPIPFDKTEEVRAIDLDRGVIILGRKERMQCFLPPEKLQELTEVGVTARVEGQLFRPFAGRPFVIAAEVTPSESDSGAALDSIE